MSYAGAIVCVAAVGGLVAVYAIFCATRGATEERRCKHEEFKLALEPGHRETMAKIGATRDTEIAKYTAKPPSQQIEGRAIRGDED